MKKHNDWLCSGNNIWKKDGNGWSIVKYYSILSCWTKIWKLYHHVLFHMIAVVACSLYITYITYELATCLVPGTISFGQQSCREYEPCDFRLIQKHDNELYTLTLYCKFVKNLIYWWNQFTFDYKLYWNQISMLCWHCSPDWECILNMILYLETVQSFVLNQGHITPSQYSSSNVI